jgi:hypothetical protein
MYYSTYHWHPLINGGGGFFPSNWNDRVANVATFPLAPALKTLDQLGDRYVLIHQDSPHYALIVKQLRALQHRTGIGARWRIVTFGTDIAIDRGAVQIKSEGAA